jgi:hypothetical protein
MRFIFLLLIVGISTNIAFAQSSDKKKKKEKYNTTQPTSKDPSFPTRQYQPNQNKIKSKGITHNAERNYYNQMARVEKARVKAEKEMAKPQYSDPMYFGHKNPPKKHKPGKIKYCKECGIRH